LWDKGEVKIPEESIWACQAEGARPILPPSFPQGIEYGGTSLLAPLKKCRF